MNHDHDPYRGLPSLTRLESDLERSERHLARGWASRHMRVIGGAGVALVLGLGFSPVGPAFGGGDTPEKADIVETLDAKIADAPGVQLALPTGAVEGDRVEPLAPTIGKRSGGRAVETERADALTRTAIAEAQFRSDEVARSDGAGVVAEPSRLPTAELRRRLRVHSKPHRLRLETGPMPRGAAKELRRAVGDA